MKLKAKLREATIESLHSICEHWDLRPDEDETMADPAALTDYLYPRLQAPTQFKQAFERLDLSQRDAVYFLALHGGEVTVKEFRLRTGLHGAAEFDAFLDGIKAKGLVWREKISDGKVRFDIIGVPEPFVRLLELPPYWKGFVGRFLQGLSLSELKAIARHVLEEKYDGRRKQVLVHFIRERLLDPKLLRALLEKQSPSRSGLFEHILKKNGACLWRELLDGGAQKRFNHSRDELLEKLVCESGVVFVSRPAANRSDSLVMVPRDIRHVIQNSFRRDERTLAELSRGTNRSQRRDDGSGFRPSVVLDNTQNIIRDLCIVLASILQRRVKVLNNGGIGRNDLKKIVPLLSHNKTIKYVAFLSLFAMTKKLLIPVGSNWRVSKTAESWFGDAKKCFAELYGFWLQTNEWNEEYIDGDVLHVEVYPQNLVGIIELRKLILRVLDKVPAETWIDFDTFAQSLLPQVAIEIPGRFDHVSTDKNHRHTKLIMESIVAESLYWFGLITLGVPDMETGFKLGSRTHVEMATSGKKVSALSDLIEEDECQFSFKVSDVMRQIFSGRYLEPDRLFAAGQAEGLPYTTQNAQFTVQPNLEIITPPDLVLDRFYHLLLFTQVKKIDIMTTLTITPESLSRGLERGLAGDQITSFLKKSSRKELPETVVQLVEECVRRRGEIDMGLAGGYILGSSRAHVEEITANSKIGKHVKDVLNERVVILNRTADLRKVAQELQKLGYLPKLASETLHVTGEGLFHVTLRPEDLYDLMAILHFAVGLEEQFDSGIFDERVRPLIELLGVDAHGDLNPDYHLKPRLSGFKSNFDKCLTRKKDEEKRRLKKQVNRLLTRAPRNREPKPYAGENPAAGKVNIKKLMKFAIEREMQVKLHYRRSTGEEIDEVIEPESLQGGRVYAFCPEDDEHHLYAIERIEQAAL